MLGIREKVEAIANPVPKKIVAIAHGDPTPHDLLIPILSLQSATFGDKRNGSEWCSAVEASQIPLFYYTGLRTPDVIPFLIWRSNQEAQFFR